MLSISPKEDKVLNEKLGCENALTLMCYEDGVEKGYITYVQNGYILNIVGFEVYFCEKLEGEAYIIAETLLKSLASYGFNHSCYYIECSKKELFPLLLKLPFVENGDKITTNLSKLFSVCKN